MLGGALINRIWALGWMLVAGAGIVYADGVISCNINGQPFNSTLTATNTITGNATYGAGCATQSSFQYNDVVNWGLPLGHGGLGYATQLAWDPATQGSWDTATASGLGIAINITPGYQGANTQLARVDNAQYVWDNSCGCWNYVQASDFDPNTGNLPLLNQNTITGRFNAPSDSHLTVGGGNPDAPDVLGLGDHLLATLNGWGPITITFGTGVLGAGFLIASTSMSFTDVIVQAWGVTNPNPNFDTPLQTYAIVDTGGGGNCGGLTTFSSTPQPCNDAPFVAVSVAPGSHLIRAITISVPTTANGSPYSAGFAIDQMNLQEVPEPDMEWTIGGSLALMAFMLRKVRRKSAATRPFR